MIEQKSIRKEFEIQQIYDIEKVARRVGGRKHNFGYVQVPFSVKKTNMLLESRAQQREDGETALLLDLCQELGLNVMSYQGLE